MEWFLLFIPGLPIMALIALCVYMIVDHIQTKRRSKSIEVGCKYKYYTKDPFKHGYFECLVQNRWDDWIHVKETFYGIDGKVSSWTMSGTQYELQKQLDKYKAIKIDAENSHTTKK